ncbi:MAG: nitrile hydratase accessory protein [Acetobacteraceae bacterium]|nr:nitrile hydratase accessory protein [Acetobacteraceae bacterium]
MSQPDGIAAAFASVEGVPRDGDGPVFAEPWQAQAFALTVQLSKAGFFTWREWADKLAGVLREAATREPRDDGSHYYDYWLLALEQLCLSKGLAKALALNERRLAWAEAYRCTPHGRPVELPQLAPRRA